MLITFSLFYVKNATFTNRQRERAPTEASFWNTIAQQVLRFELSCNGKEPLPKELLESEYVALLTLLLAVYLKNAPKDRNTKGKELSKCWCNLSDTIKSVSSIKTLRSIIQTPVLYQISWNGEASWTSIFRVIGWNTLNNYKFHFSL